MQGHFANLAARALKIQSARYHGILEFFDVVTEAVLKTAARVASVGKAGREATCVRLEILREERCRRRLWLDASHAAEGLLVILS